MKTCLFLALAIFVAGCSGKEDQEDEDFGPTPFGKGCCEQQPSDKKS